MKSEPTLAQLKKEIDSLKRQKERKMQLSSSMQEREQLLKEIKGLDMVKKNPSLLSNFGKTFGRGLKSVGKGLWKATARGSRNLSKNSPEFRDMGRTMSTKTSVNKPFSDLGQIYLPRASPMKRRPVMKRKSKKGKMKSRQKYLPQKKLSKPIRLVPSPWELP